MQLLDRVFIAIGVSKPQGNLEKLPGAVNSARRMAKWASTNGYYTLCINDEDCEVITVELLRQCITSAIDAIRAEAKLDRIVVYFAGHGAAQSIGDHYWILTKWNTRTTEAIKVSALQRMLEYYGPKQVTIIGDACQEFSTRFIDVIGSAVLDKPDENPQNYELDQFFAVDVGKQAFMVKGSNTAEAFCIFTEVMLRALEGSAPTSAFEKQGAYWVVTSHSLARHLQHTVSEEAGRYGVRMTPRSMPGFFTDCVYATIEPPQPPDIPSCRLQEPDVLYGARDTLSSPHGSIFDTDDGDTPLSDLYSVNYENHEQALSSSLNWPDSQLLSERQIRRQNFAEELKNHIRGDELLLHTGVRVTGIAVDSVESSNGALQRLSSSPGTYRILHDRKNSQEWSDVLLTLEDGRTCAVCVVQGFQSSLHFTSDDGSLSLLHHPVHAGRVELSFAINLLARMHSGLMSEDAIVDTAVYLRDRKHRVITMGCIAAQYYDAIRDVDSLRQIASFYACNILPIPLDIILFGGGSIRDYDGRLYAVVPAVEEKSPPTSGELMRRFTHERLPGFGFYPIAGRVPWTRQAWSAVATAVCDESAREWQKNALALIEFLQPGEFTSVRPEGYSLLCRLAHVNPSPEPTHSFVGA